MSFLDRFRKQRSAPPPEDRHEIGLPTEHLYSVGAVEDGRACVVVRAQSIDWNGNPVSGTSETVYTLQDIGQLVGFCLRSGNDELMQAVLSPVSAYTQGRPTITDGRTTANPTYASLGRDRQIVEAEYGAPVEHKNISDGESACVYRTKVSGTDCSIFVYYIADISHEEGVELAKGAPFPEEFIQVWLSRNADESASAHSWQRYPKAPQGVRCWIRKDDRLGFIAAEYKSDNGRYSLRIASEKRYA